MQPKKSKLIFMLLAVIAMMFLVLFSGLMAYEYWVYGIIALIGFVATFGYGFTLKAKYRKNNWL